MSLLLFFGSGEPEVEQPGNPDAPEGILVEMGLGGSYRSWLANRGTCVRHWQLGDIESLQARDEVTLDASGDGVYSGTPGTAYGMLPEYGLAKSFDGIDDKAEVTAGLSGTGGSFSVVALVRPRASGSGMPRTILRTGPAGAAVLGLTASNRAAFGLFDGKKVEAPTQLLPDEIYLVVGTYDGSVANIFVTRIETGVTEQAGPVGMTFTTPHGSGMIGAAS